MFAQRFEQEMDFTRYEYENVEARAEAEGLSLAEQIRLWEQDELRQMEQERMNMFLEKMDFGIICII
jgi:hypothetical protein